MPDRHLLVVPLPHGRHGDRGRLTVYFVPRLRERGPLSDYPEWLHWADTVTSAMTFDVMVDGQLTSSTVTPLADPAVWDAVFTAATPVSAQRPTDWRTAADKLRVGAGGEFSEAMLAFYAALATRFPSEPPPGNTVLDMPEADVLTSAGADAAREYVEPMAGDRIEEARDPDWDFHELVSLLGHHPHLLRLLGIAVELEVRLPVAPSLVRVRTNYDNGADRRGVDFAMSTTPDFWAAPTTDLTLREQLDGFLQLSEQKAFLSILDVAPSADRLRDLDHRFLDRGGAAPALVTRALTLVRPDLVHAFRNRTTRQWEVERQITDSLTSGQAVQIAAEDVAIGHRLDVFEPNSDPIWRSLFERRTDEAGYRFPTDPALDRPVDPDEGWTTTMLVTELVEEFAEPNPDTSDPFVPEATRRLDDQLHRWDGWSGAVQRPGSAVDGATGTVAPGGQEEPDADFPAQFATHYEVVEGSLPRLRFGHDYLMRARCVDLAGDSRPLSSVEPAAALTPVETFGRLEPISAPTVVRRRPRAVPGVGDDVITIVLLSDHDIDDSTVAAQERLLFPGQVDQELCELHDQPNGGAEPGSYREIARRDARDAADPWAIDPVTGEPIASGPKRQPVRYLSDPFIGSLRVFHHGEQAEHLAVLDGTWPDVSSARLEVVAGDRPTESNPDATTHLRIGVAKADIWTVDLSYSPVTGAVRQFGLVHQLNDSDQAFLEPIIENGGHWMFSARVPVALVHAVRRPLLAPQVATGVDGERSWFAERDEGSTGVTFSTVVGIDRRSTERITIAARWTDFVDDVRLDAPQLRPGGMPLGRFLTPRVVDGESIFPIEAHRAELGDTRRHAATIELEAFSSFSAYFTEERTVTLADEPVVVDARGFAGAGIAVSDSDGALARGVDVAVDNASGAVQIVPGGRVGVGDEVTVRYIPLPVSRTSAEHQPFEVIFPSTAKPPAPSVVDIVSAFARDRVPIDGGEDVVHDGNVVRVYFARPWNVSGDGECVAVMVERNPGDAPTATCLGRDPIVTGTTTPATVESFTRRFDAGTSPDGVHDLALHAVHYDADSRRWFTDIAVDNTMYRPFLRLVVARYQSDSLLGEALGPSVTLDPIRLGPSRTISVRPVDGSPDSFDITVAGADHGGAPDADGTFHTNDVVVLHQSADSSIGDDVLRWRVDVDTVTLDRSSTGDVSTWSGTIVAPADGEPHRLVIEEREPAMGADARPIAGGEVAYIDTVELVDEARSREQRSGRDSAASGRVP